MRVHFFHQGHYSRYQQQSTVGNYRLYLINTSNTFYSVCTIQILINAHFFSFIGFFPEQTIVLTKATCEMYRQCENIYNIIIGSCLHCIYWWSLYVCIRQTTFQDCPCQIAKGWGLHITKSITLHSLRLPCTHSATTSTNLTAVFKSRGRIDLFLSSDGFRATFSSCDIFWKTFLSLSVKSRLVSLNFSRLLIKSSVCRQRQRLASILTNCNILQQSIFTISCLVLVCYECLIAYPVLPSSWLSCQPQIHILRLQQGPTLQAFRPDISCRLSYAQVYSPLLDSEQTEWSLQQ